MYIMQKNSVERAKMALLADKQDSGKEINVVDVQSDHIIMMVAYKKWEKIMGEVLYFVLMLYWYFIYLFNTP